MKNIPKPQEQFYDDRFHGAKYENYFDKRPELKKEQMTFEAVEYLRNFISQNLEVVQLYRYTKKELKSE